MLAQTSFVRGVEIDAGIARRSRHSAKPVVLRLNRAERAFLLHRVADITATAESVLHNPTQGKMVSPWSRDQIVQRVVALRHSLRQDRDVIFVISPMDRLIIVDAIEKNPYFAEMHDSDPRLRVDAVRQANALRDRVAAALGQRIARIPLGAGRSRLPEVARVQDV